jgi:hypothetical protein
LSSVAVGELFALAYTNPNAEGVVDVARTTGGGSLFAPSQAIAQADALDGKRVRIGGVIDLGTNSRCLWDSLREYHKHGTHWEHVITLSEGADIWNRRVRLNHRFVIVEGTLKRRFNGSDVIDLWQCNDVRIEQDTITSTK